MRKSSTSLYDQNNFYEAVYQDMIKAKSMIIIESPFMTKRRTRDILPILKALVSRGIYIVINTKPIEEQEGLLRDQALWSIDKLQQIGVNVLMTVGHHRKLVIIDGYITWEGSLNVLSQNDSCEFMRRIKSKSITKETVSFLGLDRFLYFK